MMAAILGASQWWYARHAPPPTEEAPADTLPPATRAAVPDTGRGVERPPSPSANTLIAGRVVATVSVTTPLYRLVVDPRGGTVANMALLRYRSFTDSGPVALVPPGARFLERTADFGATRLAIDELVFVPSDSSISLAQGDTTRTLELRWEGGGRRVVQRYRFDPTSYVIDYGLELGEAIDGVLHTRIGPRLESNEKSPAEDYGSLRAVARIDREIVTRSPEDAEEGRLAYGGEIEWAGLRNKYFLALLLVGAAGPALTAATLDGQRGDSLPSLNVTAAVPIRGGVTAYRVYLGPQEFQQLRVLDHGLDEVNQYGWSWIRWMITPFAKLIVVLMLWLHRWIPSYGLVLIVFAVLVRVVMWPLTNKSFRSIQEMQKLQPEIQRLRESYKNDPQRMQQETMRLYRERKVNPLGGCLPNLIPMPILFALFFVFQSTIEFRGQSFLWLPDLSQPDPIYILPILMGLTMVVSSKLSQTDPRMAAMTYVMPIVLTFVFLNLASGLVLYYTVSNVLTFAQQWWLRGGAPMPATREVSPTT
jgi:YidC/Oxa1 family membrane protein insertase